MRSTKSNYSFRSRHVHIEFFRTFCELKLLTFLVVIEIKRVR